MGHYRKYAGTLGLSTMVENKFIEMALFSWNGYPRPAKKNNNTFNKSKIVYFLTGHILIHFAQNRSK